MPYRPLKLRPSLVCTLTVLLCFAGCSQSADVAQVHGRVTVDGSPLTSGKIRFSPIAIGGNPNPGRPAVGRIADDGSYVLGTFKDDDGAVVGKHKVLITHKGESDAAGSIPEFNRLKVVGQEFEVQAGDNEINIELTADQVKRFGRMDRE